MKLKPSFTMFRPDSASRRRRSSIEPLESRIAPASFTGAGAVLTIDLNATNELVTFSTTGSIITATLTGGLATDGGGTGGNVSGFGTASVAITSAGFTSIAITDSSTGDSVVFANSTGPYSQGFTLTLNDAASGNISFAGSSTFGASFNATTVAGFVASDAASSLTLTGAANLSITATGHDVLLKGSVAVGGSTSISAGVIQLDNAVNDFTGALQLTGPATASVHDVNDLNLAASGLAFGILGQTVKITAGGNITQSGALTATAGTAATVSIASTGGSITLTNAANSLVANAALALSVTGSNTASFTNSPGTNSALTLADITLGTGALTLVSNGNIVQRIGTGIETDGSVSLTAGATNNRDILLPSSVNRIGGAVTVTELSAGFLRDVSLRNAADNATAPTGTALTTAGNVRNLTLFFDNNGVALPGYNITGTLAVTAGGDITQTAAETVGAAGNFTILGDHAIDLSNPGNAFSSFVSLNAPQSTQPVQIADTVGLSLGTSNLGRGTFLATAVTGDITQTGGITQEKGAGAATFTVTAGTAITLTSGNNRFPGSVVFAGAGLTSVTVRNADFMADFGKLTIPSTVSTLTVRFDNASAALPSLGSIGVPLTSLSVTALGIVQKSGTAINATAATFNANAFTLNLPNASNDFTDLTLNNSGRNDVTIADIDDLNFANTSTLGSGRFTVTAGAITDSGAITQANTGPAGDVSFTSTGTITLDFGDGFLGPVSVKVTGTNTATITNTGVALTLGTVSTAVGAFTANAGSQGILQDPNSVFTLGGTSSFNATGGGTVDLTNDTNTFTGAVSLSGGTVSLHSVGAVTLGASAATTQLLVKAGGAITQTGALTVTGGATFDAGTGNVIITNAANNFSSVSIFSTGATVAVTDVGGVNVGTIKVGSGTLDLTAGGSVGTVANGSIVQTSGNGAITLTTPAGSNITLNSALNVLRGPVNVVSAKDVNVQTQGNLSFFASSTITGAFTATSGATLTLPSNLTALSSLTTIAVSTTINSDITATGDITLFGGVNFIGTRTLTSGGFVAFSGDVNTTGPLTFTTTNLVVLNAGTWTMGAQPLSITTAALLQIGDGIDRPARLITSSSITLNGGNALVNLDGTLQIGQAAGAETVTFASGAGSLTIAGALALGFGATNDQLIKTGSGPVILGAVSRLIGSGLAGASVSPILSSQTGLIVGRFANSVDAANAPRDFFAGSDIVTPAYDLTQLTVKAGGTSSATGTVSGFLPDGDQYTVTSSLGASAGLTVVEEVNGQLGIVVRNNSSAAASKLTISTSGGGNGILDIDGLANNAPGSVTITAPAANFIGSLTTAGTLTALIARDLHGTSTALPFHLSGGGPATGTTAITARDVQFTTVDLAGALGSFKAVSATNSVNLTAQKFGTLTTTGSPLGTDPTVPGVPNPGNFSANLTSTTTANGVVLTTAKIAGQLSGVWDLRGSVGSVTAGSTEQWTFGTRTGAGARNGGLLTDAKTLALGPLNNSIFDVTGMIASLTSSDLTGSELTAGSFGTVKVVPSLAGQPGILDNTTITATGNVKGVALKSLSVAGDVTSTFIHLLDGDATAITFARTISNSGISAADVNGHGNLKSIIAGRWQATDIDARTIGTLKIAGNFAAGIFGDFANSGIVVSGNSKGVGLATFDAQGAVSSSFFDIQHGNVTTFKVGRQMTATSLFLTDQAFGALGTIQAGDWTGDSVVAKTIGTVASVGVPATASASPLLLGGIGSSSITAYQNTGTAAAIGKLSTKGDLNTSTVNAEHGIGSATIGRNVFSSFIVADDSLSGALDVGRIATLTAGAWNSSAVSVNTFGAVKITGFAQPENNISTAQPGFVTAGTFLAHGATPTKPVGVDSFSVAQNFESSSVFVAPFGVKTFTVGGSVSDSKLIADNPAAPAAGFLTSVTAGDLLNSTVRGGSLGTMKVTGSVPFALLGNVNNSTIALTSAATTKTGPQALGSLTVAGDLFGSVLDAPANVGSISVLGSIASGGTAMRVQAGYAAGSKLGSITAGAYGVSTGAFTTDLVTQSVGTFTLKGNTARGLAGTTTNGFIDILGKDTAGIGLGTFTASGTATNSLFRVSDGDVTSFTVQRMTSSDLLVGFRYDKASDITAVATTAQWSATAHKIGTFKTTAPFDATDVADSASLVDSNVIASILGSITIGGVNPATINSTAFGVAFRASSAGTGVVKTDGNPVALAPSSANGQFHYLGLAG